MGLLNKKEEDADDELLGEDGLNPESAEEGSEESAPEEPEVQIPEEVIAARDGARVCALINQAIQPATAMAQGMVFVEDELASIKQQAAALADRAQGLWQAVDNGALEAGAQAAQQHNMIIDQEQLGQLVAAVIVDARNQLQDLLGKVDDGSSAEDTSAA